MLKRQTTVFLILPVYDLIKYVIVILNVYLYQQLYAATAAAVQSLTELAFAMMRNEA